jgi:hypothetical protein
MATHDYVIDNQTTPAFRSDLNNALAAIASNNSSATAPATTYANMWWMDTANNYLKIRDKNDANWIIVAEMDVTNSRVKLISDSLKAASGGGIDVLNSSGTKIIDLAIASQATAEAGTNNTELMTPLRVKQSIDENAVAYPQVITIRTSGNYTIPSGAVAVLIRASGAGGGGSTAFASGGGLGVANGSDGGNTTVTNGTLSIAVTATGGRFGEYTTSGAMQDIISGSTGGDVLNAQGAAGGRSRAGAGGNFTYDGPPDNGMAGNVVQKYVTGSNVGGQTLTVSYGAAGSAGDSNSTAGQAGYIEITVW